MQYRLAYAVWMLEDILQSRSKVAARSQLFVMYDIACTLSGHLKVGGALIYLAYPAVTFAFHSHTADQIS